MNLQDISVQLREKIRDQLNLSESLSDEQLTEAIEQAVFAYSAGGPYLSAGEKRRIVQTIFHSFRGLDLLEPLLEDQAVTEIMVNSFNEIFIERHGRITAYPHAFENGEKLQDIIQSIVAKVNRVVNESSPIVDARLKDGSRVHIVLPPIALKGPTLTIRKFPEKPLTMDDLLRTGTLTEEAAAFLKILVQAKYNILIGGGTGTGKTTFLNALAQWIPSDERIVTIEDSAELQICNIPNLVCLETRNANTEGKGEITIRQLIRAALRMRPNRIIVGEVRGPEGLDMLQAMNTGHDGSISTGHANSAADMLSRLETMALSAAPLPLPVIRRQIASAIDILVHLSRMCDRSRKVMEISEIVGVEQEEIRLNPLFHLIDDERICEDGTAKAADRLVSTGNSLQRVWKLRLAGLTLNPHKANSQASKLAVDMSRG